MAAIDLSSISAPLNDGILQLQNGVAMSSTLTSVTDQSNTASTLKLSTTSAQFTSPLRITTDDPSDFYLDCEDGSTNNRFSITRNTASQQVNLNFASNPAGSNTIVGAIRTYVDGVNLSEVMSFREDGYIGANTTTPNTNFDVNGQINAATRLSIAGASWSSGTNLGGISIYPSSIGGFATATYNFASGAGFAHCFVTGAGNRLFINDAGVGVNSINPTAKLQVVGSGSTSATTSLLVQNSAGNERLRVYDDGTIFMGSTNPGIYTTFGYSGRIGNNIFESPSEILRYGGGQLIFYGRNNNANAFLFDHNNQQASNSTGISMINLGGGYENQSSFEFANLRISPTYNFNSNTTTNAIARGIYYNPTITNLRVANHYGIQTTSGGAYINTTTPQASACLQADSTTQGFLPPRMTDAQIRAIATPAEGLVAYNTDISHLCCYQAGAWVKLSHSPM